jgi:hemerythrin
LAQALFQLTDHLPKNMPHIEWTEELELGIPVIDGQHRRIVDYINEIHALRHADRETVGRIVEDLIDYTCSHFAFEETLLEEAGYEALSIHRETHNAFRRRIASLKERHVSNEDVSAELAQLLEVWLIQHIQEDDASYAPLVHEWMKCLASRKQDGSWLNNALRRFFGESTP